MCIVLDMDELKLRLAMQRLRLPGFARPRLSEPLTH